MKIHKSEMYKKGAHTEESLESNLQTLSSFSKGPACSHSRFAVLRTLKSAKLRLGLAPCSLATPYRHPPAVWCVFRANTFFYSTLPFSRVERTRKSDIRMKRLSISMYVCVCEGRKKAFLLLKLPHGKRRIFGISHFAPQHLLGA